MKILPPETITFIAVAGIIFFGVLAHATAQFKLHRDNGLEFTWIDFVVLLPLATFSGLIFGLVGSLVFSGLVPILICAGTGAFLGVAGMNSLANALLEFLVGRIKK